MPDLAKMAFGRLGYLAACLSIFMFNFGVICAQLIMMAQVIPEILYFIFRTHSFLIQKHMVLIYLGLLLSPVAYMRRIQHFAVVSFISQGCLYGMIGLITLRAFVRYDGEYLPVAPPHSYDLFRPLGFLNVRCFL